MNDRGYANPDVLVTKEWVAEHLNDPNVRIVEKDYPPSKTSLPTAASASVPLTLGLC
jgi:3-mercaptopyruvate sulfurtransferase SseA